MVIKLLYLSLLTLHTVFLHSFLLFFNHKLLNRWLELTVIWIITIFILLLRLLINLFLCLFITLFMILFAYFVTLRVNLVARKYFFLGRIIFCHFLNTLGLILRAVCRGFDWTIEVCSCLVDFFLATLLLDHALRLAHELVLLFLLFGHLVNYLNLVCFVKLFNFHKLLHCLVTKCRLIMPMLLGRSEVFEAIGSVGTRKWPYLWYVDQLVGWLFFSGDCVLICLNCDWILQVA